MIKKRYKKLTKKQSGLVSLIVVAILAVVLGLIAVGFSKLMDREARHALDNELSAQAYYAAISGLNDARAWLFATGAKYSLNGCSDWKTAQSGSAYFTDKLDSAGATKYSCVSVDTTPKDLSYPLNADQSVTFSLNNQGDLCSVNGTKCIDKMYFGWQNPQTPNSFVPLSDASCSSVWGKLPQVSSGSLCKDATGLLEVNIFAAPNGYTTDIVPGWPADTNLVLSKLSRTYYMYPNSGGGNAGTIDYTTQNGSFVPGNCTAGGSNPLAAQGSTVISKCNTEIYNLNYRLQNWTYYVRLTARYAPINVTVQAQNTDNSLITQIPDAQAVVDVTGQGTDVLQRIRARVNLSKAYQIPSYGIQSMEAVCKGFNVDIKSLQTYGDASNDASISPFNANSACAYPNGGGAVVGTAGDLQNPSTHQGLPPVTDPFPLITASLSAGPNPIYTGQSSVLTWGSSGAKNCTGNGGPPGFSTGNGSPPNGSATITFPTAGSYKYWVTCTGYGPGTDSNPVTITVKTPPAPQINSFYASPTTVANNGTSTIYWTTTYTTSCRGTGFSTGGNTNGSAPTPSLSTGSHAFWITCTGLDGVTQTSAGPIYVTANPPPPNCTVPAISGQGGGGTYSATASCPGATSISWSYNWKWYYPVGSINSNSLCANVNGSTSSFTTGTPMAGTIVVTFTVTGTNAGGSSTKSNTQSWSRSSGFTC